jgi:four helix bundle protein
MTHEPRRDLPERTFQFALRIVMLCQSLDTRTGVARVLARQLLRSGTSVGANVEEGQAAQTEADFLTKHSIACKEARETHYWLRLLSAAEVFPAERLRDLTQECNELVAILTASVKRLKERRHDH